MPKLSQIREGKASKKSRSRGSSTISATTGLKTRRRRQIEDDAVNRARDRHKHGSSPRYPDSLATLSSPSLMSVDSSATQQSGASGGSNSTARPRSHDYSEPTVHAESPPCQDLRVVAKKPLTTPKSANTNPPPADVFRFLRPDSRANSIVSDGTHHMTPPTTASSSSLSSGDTQLEDDQSSVAGIFPHEIESPTSSPLSMRKSDNDDFHYQGRDYRKSGAPLYASSFVHGHGQNEETSGEDEEENEESEGRSEKNCSDEASETGSEEDQDEYDRHRDLVDHGHAPSPALSHVPPYTTLATSSRQSDVHTKRLRQQERNLAHHVLQSPQPHRNVQFTADPSANRPAMPLYSPRAYATASPATLQAPSGPSLAWPPPMPSLPAPLPIGYSPHESPENSHAFPVTVRTPGEGGLTMPPSFPGHRSQPTGYPGHASGPDLSRTTVVGYELLAEKLSEPRSSGSQQHAGKGDGVSIVPMYRKFEHLNHRVLLHLQDEVNEMEEELRYLDEAIAQTSPRDESGRPYPGSRRGDARYGGELHYRRTELLGRIFQKLGQYNQALSSFHTLLKEMDPSTTEDVKAYRAWMDKRTPIDSAETQFLARQQDLVVVSRTSAVVADQQSATVWFPLILCLPLLAFAIVPSLLGRLTVITLVCGAAMRMVTVTSELTRFLSWHEWTVAGFAYFGMMSLLAGLAR